MSHTFTNLLTHVVFSTKERMPLRKPEIAPDVHSYLGGIVRELGGTAVIVNGVQDHVHMLVRLPAELAVAECLRVVKTNSSRWIHQRWPEKRNFAWQTGYGAFAVSASNEAAVVRYIRDQEKHHAKVSFRDEFIALLRKHRIEFDEKFLWK